MHRTKNLKLLTGWYSVLAFAASLPICFFSEDAVADVISCDTQAVVPIATIGAMRPLNANGTYTLVATAQVNNRNPTRARTGPSNYQVGAGPFSDTSQVAEQSGRKFRPQAEAKIEYGGTFWSSQSSFATCNQQPEPQDVAESARATATVTDPRFWEPLEFDQILTFEVVIEEGSEISAFATEGDFASASLSSSESTDLNNLGEMWSFQWYTNSTSPGTSVFDFTSNPTLGLDDSQIEQDFLSKIVGDPLTGINRVVEPFSFSFDLLIPANTAAEFTGTTINTAEGRVAAPEPASVLGLLALGTLGASSALKRKLKPSKPTEKETIKVS